ncbi:MAG: hypothetical protein K0U98_18310 [Deltaproteobacteria bacterium]|nr:hypothetical protein [Deltaproteobacteria bacterium]
MMRRVSGWLLTASLLSWTAPASLAQLSPGPLSAPHESLEGSRQCLQCHESGQGVAASLCLDCHQLLGQRIATGQGLHARPDYQECQTCHIDHHGRNFELIYWGEKGRAAFDHQLTGYSLEGAHGQASCADCHRPENIPQPIPLKKAGKSLSRTYLGLDTSCASCHDDQHQGQFASTSCADCHDSSLWKPASLFDHQTAAFPLTGRHESVACDECHASEEGEEGVPFVRYTEIPFQSCTDCHQDPHRGRLGNSCESCHDTSSWEQVNLAGFDHRRTRFPLLGQHRQASCESCHGDDRSMRLTGFERCDSCHGDVHLGQFQDRPLGSDCASCHDSSGFVPALFGLEEHRLTDYPLTGAHRAVPCGSCHVELPAENFASFSQPPPTLSTRSFTLPTKTRSYRFSATACTDCHEDPHLGDTDSLGLGEACVSCHGIDSWREISFDHDSTQFPLLGAHGAQTCTACHLSEPQKASAEDKGPFVTTGLEIRFAGAPTACRQCHEDPHGGQFDQPRNPASCDSCHGQEGWQATLFDHDRDSSFPLDGAHGDLSCDSCHPSESQGEATLVRFRPLPHACSDCHDGTGGRP